ncbi:putative glutamyl-tRNA amidotransferase subunit A [Exophiala viscosa]|uniref:Glutamyl-tRNA amidotransferase subunit A n=1 Tax=Exophiala viscosa TaxID=2486360 RepID=A0AAN6IHG1_9EURO|nr:putative glutamyl-tRNA amidotransferase subunit A [Exophiala viscosa]
MSTSEPLAQGLKSANAGHKALEMDISIETLHGLYNAGSATPTDVVREVYSRIASYFDKAVWITLIPEAEALQCAKDLEQQYPNVTDRPALYGIPFSLKDSVDFAGMRTTVACESYAYTATSTAPVAQRVLDAGGILIGKTNLDQFATGLTGTRSPYGMPRCVHDSDYVSGGSSSGSVVSVAANLVSFTICTDTAGSTRVPASFNGMVGLKPTLGTISAVGLIPAVQTADCVCIIAATIDSTLKAWDVMRAYDEDDVYARDPAQLSLLTSQPVFPTGTSNSSITYGLPPQDLVYSVLSPEYSKLFSAFLAKLQQDSSFYRSTDFDYAPFASANAMLYGSSIVSQRIVAFKPYLDTHGYDQLHPVIRDIFKASSDFSAVRAYQDIFALAKDRRLAAKQFRSNQHDGIDVLIVPSTTMHPTVSEILADPINLNKHLGEFTHFVNLLDLCAVAVPLSATWTSKNGKKMPFSVTLISTPGRDRDLLELGRKIMAMTYD